MVGTVVAPSLEGVLRDMSSARQRAGPVPAQRSPRGQGPVHSKGGAGGGGDPLAVPRRIPPGARNCWDGAMPPSFTDSFENGSWSGPGVAGAVSEYRRNT